MSSWSAGLPVAYLGFGLLRTVTLALLGRQVRHHLLPAEVLRAQRGVRALRFAGFRLGGVAASGRLVLTGLSDAVLRVTLWPLYRRRPNRFSRAHDVLRPPAPRQAGGILVCAVLLADLRWVNGPGTVLTASAYLLLLNLAALSATWTIATPNLIAQLRRSIVNPFVTLALVTAISFGSLTLLAAILVPWAGGGPISVTDLLAEARSILTFTKFTALVAARDQPASTIVVALSSFVFYSTLLSQLIKITQFRRTAADLEARARAYIVLGDAGDVWATLQRARKLDGYSVEVVRMQVDLNLMEEDLDSAFENTRTWFAVQGMGGGVARYATHTVDDCLAFISSSAATLSPSHEQARRLVAFCCRQGISDGCLTVVMTELLVQRQRMAGVNDVPFDVPGMTPDAYPLAVAYMTVKRLIADSGAAAAEEGVRSHARELLSALTLDAPSDRAVRDLLLATFREVSPENPRGLVDGFLAAIRSVETRDAPAWLCSYVLGMTASAISMATMLGIGDAVAAGEEEYRRISAVVDDGGTVSRKLGTALGAATTAMLR